jgi:hypothetical protein
MVIAPIGAGDVHRRPAGHDAQPRMQRGDPAPCACRVATLACRACVMVTVSAVAIVALSARGSPSPSVSPGDQARRKVLGAKTQDEGGNNCARARHR